MSTIDAPIINAFQYLPARLGDFLSTSPVVGDVKSLLIQIAFALSFVFACIIAYVAVKRRHLKALRAEDQPSAPQSDMGGTPTLGALRGRWDEIIRHLDSTHENDWKLAVLEADTLVDSALQQAGFPGDTFGDRLTNIQPGTLVSLDGIWWAHRIRNRVAHELDYFLRYTEARQAVSYYEAALSELKLI